MNLIYTEPRPLTADDWERDFTWQCKRLVYLLDVFYVDLTTATRFEYLFRNLTNAEFDKLLDDPDAGRFAGIAHKEYIPELRELLKNERIKNMIFDPYVKASTGTLKSLMDKLNDIEQSFLEGVG
jgi:hypothetical protein